VIDIDIVGQSSETGSCHLKRFQDAVKTVFGPAANAAATINFELPRSSITARYHQDR